MKEKEKEKEKDKEKEGAWFMECEQHDIGKTYEKKGYGTAERKRKRPLHIPACTLRMGVRACVCVRVSSTPPPPEPYV